MPKLKKTLPALLLACCLLFSACTGGLAEAWQRYSNDRLPDAPLAALPYIDPNIKTPFTPQVLSFYYDQLGTENARRIYRAYLQFLIDGDAAKIYIKGDYTRAEITAALAALQSDYPQFLARSWGYTCTYYSTTGGSRLGVELQPLETDTDFSSLQQELYAALNALLQRSADYQDPWQRQLFLYDALIGGAAYSSGTANAAPLEDGEQLPLRDRLGHTAYGGLVQCNAVCDGYAFAYQLLCSYAGIPAATVTGMSSKGEDPGGDYVENHAWNLVMLDGQTYYCDPTWDDNGGEYVDADGGRITDPVTTDGLRRVLPQVLHRYFDLSYAQMAQDHVFGPRASYAQEAGPARDYFAVKGLTAASGGELEHLLAAACADAEKQDVGFEVRLDYTVPSYAQEIFARLGMLGLNAEAQVGYSAGSGCCYVFIYHR